MARGVSTAISVLKNGGVVVFGTETAYGIGCDARVDHAVEKLMQIKGRDLWKTPPLIAADLAMVEEHAELSEMLRELAKRFWPGPLTMVVPVRSGSHLSPHVIRDGTVAIRVSSNLIARQLSKALIAPVVATSANVAGEENCYRIEDVRAQLGTQLPQPDFFLDGGVLEACLPSTIIKEQDGEIIVIRQGEIVCNAQKNTSDRIG